MPSHAVRPAETAPEKAGSARPIVAEGVSVVMGTGVRRQQILRDVSLAVPEGAFVCLVGPSGCGKSTLLKTLAGLTRPTSGHVLINGLAPRAAARARMIGLVFQDANLLPWKSALDNAALLRGIADKTMPRAELRDLAQAMLELVGLGAAGAKRPGELSGGMRQRVAIARALALDPAVLLMDEPFGALDAITRDVMGHALLDIWRRTGKTIVLVTHSIEEALFLAGEIHVLGAGPGRIVKTLAVPLPYPRDEGVMARPDVLDMKRGLRAALRPDFTREAAP